MPWYSARVDSGVNAITIVDTVQAPVILRGKSQLPISAYDFAPLVAAWHREILTVGSRESTIEVRRASGELVSSIRMRRPPMLIDQAMVARDIDGSIQFVRENFSGLSHRGAAEPSWDAMRAQMAASVVSDTIGPFRDVRMGDDGTAWLKDGGYWHADTTWAWTGVTRDGRVAGRLTGRGKDRIVAFGAGSALTREENADGVMVFRVHRLMPVEKQ
jgi:hypothetical protein